MTCSLLFSDKHIVFFYSFFQTKTYCFWHNWVEILMTSLIIIPNKNKKHKTFAGMNSGDLNISCAI